MSRNKLVKCRNFKQLNDHDFCAPSVGVIYLGENDICVVTLNLYLHQAS